MIKTLPMSIEEIMQLIPQRYPMLMLDKVIELNEEKIIAIKNISGNDPIFIGHFPNFKIYPGVLLTESIAQASIILFNQFKNSNDSETNKTPVLYHTNIKFKKVVVPGDQLFIHVNLRKKVLESAIVDGTIYVNDEIVASGSLTFTIKQM
ncbi:3-hydroxyacyl-ACP dehydratase FabZ [Lysinibacillus sp. NPDC059133]|uniref:3-hydroxyacyl-ACP dehydratase FabZ n=1 Tax=Lysinibacillus sp. NPDC059133 TaxID=3346737 RepID=UPI00369A4AD2